MSGKVMALGVPKPSKAIDRAIGPATVPLGAPVDARVGFWTVMSHSGVAAS